MRFVMTALALALLVLAVAKALGYLSTHIQGLW